MSVIISYHLGQATKDIASSLHVLESRYNNLKNMMLNQNIITQEKKKKMAHIRRFLTTLNANAQYLNDNILLEKLSNAMSEGAIEVLETLSSSSSALLDPQYSTIQKDQFFSALGKLYSLLEMGRGKKNISFDYHSLTMELNKIAAGFLNKNSLVETGNALGRIGAQGVAPILIQDGIDSILKELDKAKSTGNVAIIKDTGTQKISGTRRSITTDTLVESIDPKTGLVQAVLRLSDKFNAKYSKANTSTKVPVKLATRNVKTFLNEVSHPLSKTAYEKAIMNYISYHKANLSDYHRTDVIKIDRKGWTSLRRAIGAEMMYNDIFIGKGKFQNNTIDDIIDLYVYGNKIFLSSDILNTVSQRKGSRREFNLAQISLYQRNNIITNTQKLNSLPTKPVLAAAKLNPEEGGQNKVYTIIENAIITYSQTINF